MRWFQVLGLKNFKYPVYTLLVFYSNQIAIPIAWVISASFSSHDVHKWIRTLYDRVCAKDSTWRLNGFIVDDALTETAKIRDVFQCSTLLCLWRVRRAWQSQYLANMIHSRANKFHFQRAIAYKSRFGDWKAEIKF